MGAVLGDGSIIELVQKAGSPATALLIWDGKKWSLKLRIHRDGVCYVPAKLPADLKQALFLSTVPKDFDCVGTLFTRLVAQFETLGGIRQENAELFASFSLATHLADSGAYAPRALVAVRDMMEGTEFLRLLSCFCRNSISISNLDRYALGALPPGLLPTLLINSNKLSPSILRTLDGFQARGFADLRGGRLSSPRLSVAILDLGGSVDEESIGAWLRISAIPQSRPALLDERKLEQLRREFAPQLLNFRLQTWRAASESRFDPLSLTGTTRALASSLGACLEGNSDLQNRIVTLVEGQVPLELFGDAKVTEVVVEAALVVCHEDRPVTHVGELTEVANGILAIRQNGVELTARRVGRVLRSLGLNLRRDNTGYRFVLSSDVRRHFHQVGQSLNVPFLKSDAEPCSFCRELLPAHKCTL